MIKAIPYYRVSTERQGQSGLGLEAQRSAVRNFARSNNFKLLKEYTEVETATTEKRPILLRALEQCKKESAILLIAKQDRLSRKVTFISMLIDSGVPYLALDNPSKNKFMAHVNAAWAEKEHDEISDRTKKALQAAKNRGVVLGRYGKEVLSKRNIRKADAFARKMRPLLGKLNREGFRSVRKIMDELNKRNIETYRGKKGNWHATTVQNLIKRIASLRLK